MRPLLLALAITSVLVIPAWSGEPGVDPPVVTIYSDQGVEVDSIAVQIDESFSLIGTAVGEIPLIYYWYVGESNPEMIATGRFLVDYSFTQPGEYVITLEVVDCYDLSGFASVIVIVEEIPVPIQVTTWGRIKALFE
jgi:hypothetical protein